jgi:hypothetical protein
MAISFSRTVISAPSNRARNQTDQANGTEYIAGRMGLAVSLPPMSSNDLDGSGITCICQRSTEQ